MKNAEMKEWLLGLDVEERLPLWVISYNRAGTAPFLRLLKEHARKHDDINVVVRRSQRDAYQAAYPTMNIRPLPDDTIPNCGSARWGAADLAWELGNDVVLIGDVYLVLLVLIFILIQMITWKLKIVI